MVVTYPRGELDQKGTILSKIGSFWSYQYEDPMFLETLYRAESDDYEQQHQTFLDALDCLSRQDTPLYQRQWWRPITLKQSELASVDAAKILYGQLGLKYGGGSRYGDLAITDRPLYPVATDVAGIKLFMNRMNAPSATLTQGVDFELYPGYISFLADPFSDGRFATRPVYDINGSLVDTELALWGFAVDSDQAYLWNHVGYVVGRNYPTSQYYKDYLNAIWDQHSWGPTTLGIRKLITSAMGVPLVEEDGEVVQKIFDTEYQFVITDKHVYRYELGAVVTVSVDDIVNQGDTLTDIVEFVELYGNSPDISRFEGIVLGPGMIRDHYLGSLYFINDDVDLEYIGIDSDGYAEVRFAVGGFPLDVSQFWSTVHTRGKASGDTLAHLLDTRVDGNGEPQPQNLPATVNPMEIVTELIGANFMMVKVRTALTATGALGIHAMGAVRDAMPPNTSIIFYVEMEAEQETFASADVVNGSIVFGYGITADTCTWTVDDPEGYSYVAAGEDFVLVDGLYVVIGSALSGGAPGTYGHLPPTLRKIATDCAQ